MLDDPSLHDTQERHRPIGDASARRRDLSEYSRVGSLFHHARGDEVSLRDDIPDRDPCILERSAEGSHQLLEPHGLVAVTKERMGA